MYRGDCQKARETVSNLGRLSESRQHCERSGDVIMEAATSSQHHDDVVTFMTTSPLLSQCCRLSESLADFLTVSGWVGVGGCVGGCGVNTHPY